MVPLKVLSIDGLPIDTRLPPSASGHLVREIRTLSKGHPREREIEEWLEISWPDLQTCQSLVLELRQDAKGKLPTQGIDTARTTNRQSNLRQVELEKEKLRKAKEEADRKQAELALQRARERRERKEKEAQEQRKAEWVQQRRMQIEEALWYAWEQEQIWQEHRVDIMGLYGEPTLASPPDRNRY